MTLWDMGTEDKQDSNVCTPFCWRDSMLRRGWVAEKSDSKAKDIETSYDVRVDTKIAGHHFVAAFESVMDNIRPKRGNL